MADLPQGVVTVLFSDIEGSTRLLQDHGDRWGELLAEHQELMRAAFRAHDGHEVSTQGDSFFVAFADAPAALRAAVDAQKALAGHTWGSNATIRVRMGLHTGKPNLVDGDYWGIDIHRAARVCSAAHGGQVLLTKETHAALSDAVPGDVSFADLGEHLLKDLEKPEHLHQLVIASLPSEFPPIRSLKTPSNLPVQTNSFVGREQELAALGNLVMQGECRLVTLTGPGGAGKTRLALAVGESVAENFPSGVFFIALAALQHPDLVVETIAQVLGVKDRAGSSIAAELRDHLAHRKILLILDNFEHVIDAAPAIGELLAAATDLKVIVTSRSVLNLRGEREYKLPPLSLPDVTGSIDVAAAAGSDAVKLFVDRAKATMPSFEATPENLPALARICARLDALPLAIELAAARIKLLSPQDLLKRLDRQLQLLTGGPGDVDERHQTLRGTIEWSHDLLDPSEQKLFRWFAPFVGGCTIHAAEDVFTMGDISELEILDGITSLVDKSLLDRLEGPSSETRFRMLRTIRDFAAEKLSAEEDAGVRLRHARYYCMLAEAADPELTGDHQVDWLTRVAAELPNMRGALRWLLEEGERSTEKAELGLRLAAALGKFWNIRSHVVEGCEWLEAALQMDPGTLPGVRATALHRLGVLWEERRDQKRAIELFEESLSIGRSIEDGHRVATLLNSLGVATLASGDVVASRKYFEESLALKRETGDEIGIATSLGNLGLVAMDEGELATATELLEESLAISRRINDEWGVAISISNLAVAALFHDDLDGTRSQACEALGLFQALEDMDGVAECFETMSVLAIRQGDIDNAARLVGAAATLREAFDTQRRPADEAWLAAEHTAARAELGREPYDAAFGEGRTLTAEAAATLARTV